MMGGERCFRERRMNKIRMRMSLHLFLVIFLLLVSILLGVADSRSSSSSRTGSMSRRESRRNEEKKTLPSTPTPSIKMRWTAFNSSSLSRVGLNSTRNIRQIPEIPALYSAPEIQTPEIPALYSAPKKPDSQNSQNELDSPEQTKVTTEISLEEENEEGDEDTSEPYQQYGVPTEKSSNPNPNPNEPNQEEESFNEYPTESFPFATSRTNEIDQEDEENNSSTEDSYSSGYDGKQPSDQYGPPSEPKSEYLPPSKPKTQYGTPSSEPERRKENGQNYGGNNRRKSMRKMNSNNKRPSEQEEEEQTENSLEPEKNQMNDGENEQDSVTGYPQDPFYLPPVHHPRQPQDHFGEEELSQGTGDNSMYQDNINGYQQQQPPNPNYRTIPDSSYGEGVKNNEDASRYNGHDSPPMQDLGQGRQTEGNFPRSGEPQEQGQSFGPAPNSVYGLPSVNHLNSGAEGEEEELEGLNEKIVDAELLDRVHQIIEDHERQQKNLLDQIQKNNEKQFPTSSYSSAPGFSGFNLDSNSNTFTGRNELGNIQQHGHDNGERNGAGFRENGNEERKALYPHPQYGTPQTFTNPSDFSNGYSNSNLFRGRETSQSSSSSLSYLPPYNSQNGNDNLGKVPSSRNEGGGDKSSDKSSAEVEYQKAILSTHFTETHPDNGQLFDGDGDGPNNSLFRLNSESGPGVEYLPPPSVGYRNGGVGSGGDAKARTSGRQEVQRNSQNAGYSNSFPPGGSQAQPEGENSYSVKLSTGIMVGGGNGESEKTSFPSSKYGPPAKISSSSSNVADQPREFHARQDGSSLPGVFNKDKERFPLAQKNEVGGSSSGMLTSGNDSGFWSRTPKYLPPQTNYGVPFTLFNGPSSSSSSSQEALHPPNDNRLRNTTPQTGAKYPNKIMSSGDEMKSSNDPNQLQRSYNFQQQQDSFYLPPSYQAQNVPPRAAVMVTVPRPVYGVPLAPVITLDAENNLESSYNGGNDRGSRSREGALPIQSYSPGASKPSSYFTSPQQQDHSTDGSSSSSSSGSFPTGIMGQDNLLNSPQRAPFSYGMLLDNSPSSSPPDSTSPFFSGQGQTGISNAFALPIYEYTPSHQTPRELLNVGAASSSPVVISYQQLLQHLPHLSGDNIQILSSAESLPSLLYGSSSSSQGLRISRRALSKKASISSAPNQTPERSTTSNHSNGPSARE